MAQYRNTTAVRAVPLARTYDATISSSTQVDLNTATTVLEVTALAQAVFYKWGTTAVTTSNFDGVVAAGTTKILYVPLQATGLPYANITFIEHAATANLAVVEF